MLYFAEGECTSGAELRIGFTEDIHGLSVSVDHYTVEIVRN